MKGEGDHVNLSSKITPRIDTVTIEQATEQKEINVITEMHIRRRYIISLTTSIFLLIVFENDYLHKSNITSITFHI